MAKERVEEEFMDFERAQKPKYTLTTTMDDGETNSTSTVTPTKVDALMQILKSAGVTDDGSHGMPDGEEYGEMGYDDGEEVDMEIGSCGDMGGEQQLDDEVGMDIEFAPETETSRNNSHDDMMYMLNIMDGTNEEVDIEEEQDWDNEPNIRDLPHDSGSRERNTANVRGGVASPGDNKLASGYEMESTKEDRELSGRLHEEWQRSFKMHEVKELSDNQKKYFGEGSRGKASAKDLKKK